MFNIYINIVTLIFNQTAFSDRVLKVLKNFLTKSQHNGDTIESSEIDKENAESKDRNFSRAASSAERKRLIC